MKRKRNSVLAALLLLALVAGCSKKEQQAPAAPAKPKTALPAKPAPAPGAAVQKPLSSATRAPGGARLDFSKRNDPFKPYLTVAPPIPGQSGAQAVPRPTGEQLPIQSYDVTKFKLVGIIAGMNANKALLIDPGGKGYVVQEGMEIGTNQGRITKITASSVEVIERLNEGGRTKKKKVVLTLAKKR